MKEVSEAVRLNIDNLEKEVMVLKKSLETAKQQMEKVDEDVKEQMTEFLDVNLFSFSEVSFIFSSTHWIVLFVLVIRGLFGIKRFAKQII